MKEHKQTDSQTTAKTAGSAAAGSKHRTFGRPRSAEGGTHGRGKEADSRKGNRDGGTAQGRGGKAGPGIGGARAAQGAASVPSRAQAPASPVSAALADLLRVGDTIIVSIKRIGINGEGVGYYKRKTVFIPGALPDETVKATVSRVEPKLIHAALKQVETASPHRKKPDCPVYDTCGGCQLQHMTYEGQLKAKEEMVREAFSRYAGMADVPIRPIIGMDHPWAYRNKAQLQLGMQNRAVVAGLYAAGSRRLVDITGCPIQHPEINRVVKTVRDIVESLGIPLYQEKTRTGTLRTIVARVAVQTGRVQLTLVTATDHLPLKDKLIVRVRNALPSVISIAQNVNPEASPLVFGSVTRVLWGKEHLEEKLGDVQLSLSPRAFFQLNPEQTVKLYESVREAAALTGSELVIDAYCGTGTIGLWLAPHAREVRGVEAIAEAVADAQLNARQSGLTNARFYQARAEQLLPQWVREGLRPDVVVVDPPRTGCEQPLLDAVAAAHPPRLVYVSCNPATLAKDCSVLAGAGYRIDWVQPVDMFPQTSHVECVVRLYREK